MFVKWTSSIEALPPTEDALSFHIMCSNYQAFIWRTALTNDTELASPEGNGWTVKAGKQVALVGRGVAPPDVAI